MAELFIFLFFFFLVQAVFMCIGISLAHSRNRDPALWGAICGISGLVGVISLGLAEPLPDPDEIPANRRGMRTSAASEGPNYDIHKWNALLEVDDELRSLNQELAQFGKKYADEFAEKYLALNDRAYLGPLSSKIRGEAMKVRAEVARVIQPPRDDWSEAAAELLQEYSRQLAETQNVDPDFDKKVARCEIYAGHAKAFINGIKVVFTDGSCVLRGKLIKRYFETEVQADAWV